MAGKIHQGKNSTGLPTVTEDMHNSASVLEAADRSICIIDKHNKAILYANSKFYELIGKKPATGAGGYCYDFLCGNPAFKTNDNCLCFSTINLEKPFEYYNPESKQYLSMYGREIMWGDCEAYVFFLTDQTEEKFKDKQLKNAQERFEMTLDNSGLFIWEYDIINNQCINSAKAVREYGIPYIIDNYPESLYEMGHTPPETVAQLKEVKKRLLNGETGFSVERRTINGEGKSQWMNVSYRLEKDSAGRPARALICGMDITEQKERELAYEEEIRLKKTVTGDTEVLAILNLTQNCVATNDVKNPILAKHMQLKGINVIMSAVCDTFIEPSDREQYKTRFNREKMLESYKQGKMHDFLRHQFLQQDGWFESAYDLIFNPSTGDVEAVCTIKNVTAEVRSKQVVNKLTSIDYADIVAIDAKTGYIYKFTKEGGKNDAADKQQYEDYVASGVKDYCTPEEAKRLLKETSMKVILEKLQTMPIYSILFLMNYKGRKMRMRNIYTYLDQSRKTILCACQDITDSYLQEEKQRQDLSEALARAEVANRAKTMFLSRVSHDMRTPLNGVLGLTSLMLDKAKDQDMVSDLRKLELSGKYLLNLINDILDVSSIEADKMELHPTVCHGNNVLNNIRNLIKPGVEGKHIQFKVNAEKLVQTTVWLDESRLQQVAMNFLGNAIKFTPEGGLVELSAETISEDDNVLINKFVLSDTGVGMDKEFIPRLFEPFSQENGAFTNSKNGTGLGLAIAKKIIDLMHGTISVASEKGVGTTFTLIMPFPKATKEQIAESQAAKGIDNTSYNLENKRVLLCEDHPINREIAKRILEKAGVKVEFAENGKEGLELFEKSVSGYYDAILMDVRMPVMDGLEASALIRKLSRADAATIPIIAMTANVLVEDVKRTNQAGMNAHLPKPINAGQLYSVLDKYTNK